MNNDIQVQINDRWIIEERPAKNSVSPWEPYAYFVEKERSHNGNIEDVATIFLTNRECPFRCLMCDLWKNTLDYTVPVGAIPKQILWALRRLPTAKHIKLYNSGNFFDTKAIPKLDILQIAKLLDPFKSVIIENHPRLVDERCLLFQDLLKPSLQVAMGLETVHPEVLKRLNKRMTLDDFECATRFLTENGILVRAFILLCPPFLNETEGITWAKFSIEFAFEIGVECCVIIPTRPGNGALDYLHAQGHFSPPSISALEEVLDYGIRLKRGRVFADLWDVKQFSNCEACIDQRVERMHQMNLSQSIITPIACSTCGTAK